MIRPAANEPITRRNRPFGANNDAGIVEVEERCSDVRERHGLAGARIHLFELRPILGTPSADPRLLERRTARATTPSTTARSHLIAIPPLGRYAAPTPTGHSPRQRLTVRDRSCKRGRTLAREERGSVHDRNMGHHGAGSGPAGRFVSVAERCACVPDRLGDAPRAVDGPRRQTSRKSPESEIGPGAPTGRSVIA